MLVEIFDKQVSVGPCPPNNLGNGSVNKPPASTTAQSRDKPWLLIVEADIELKTQLRWHFNNYNVAVADAASTAMSPLTEQEPSVVLLDLDGVAVASGESNGVNFGVELMQEILRL